MHCGPISAARRRSGAATVPPAFQTTGGTAGSSGINNTDVAYPTGIQTGDILLLFVQLEDASGNASITGVTGSWNTVDAIAYDVSSDMTGALYWKRATGTETGTENVALSESVDTDCLRANITRFSGCIDNATPFEGAAHNASGLTGSLSGSDVTTTGPNRLVVTFFGCQNRNTAGTETNTNGWTEAWATSTVSGNDASESCNYITATSAGLVSACTRTRSASCVYISFTLALIPA